MRFLAINGFCLRGDRMTEFQEWVVRNEDRIRAAYPEGTEYGGIYVATMTTEKNAGEWFWIDILDSYGAMDRIAAANKDQASEMSRINAEFLEFLDPDRHLGWSSTLLKSATDATVWNFPTS